MRNLFLLCLLALFGCSDNTADGGPGFMCDGRLTALGASPTDGQVDVATDAHPGILWGNTTGCPMSQKVTATGFSIDVKQAVQTIDGTTQVTLEGDSLLLRFVPTSPLMPNTEYVIESNGFHTSFKTGSGTASPPPAPTTVSLVQPTFSDDYDQTLEVRAPFGGSAAIVHFMLTDEKGNPSTAKYAKSFGFIVPGTLPVGDIQGILGFSDIAELCFVAETENEAGVLSPRSKPRCAAPGPLKR